MHGVIGFAKRVVKRFGECQAANWATIIAWNGMTATVPIILAIVAILGFVLRGATDPGAIETNLLRPFGPEYATQLQGLFTASKNNSGVLALVSIAGFFWSGSGLFGAIDQGLNALYPSKPRSFIRQKLVSFGMIFIFALMTGALVFTSVLLSTLQDLSFLPDALRSGAVGALLQIVFGVIDCSLLFTVIMYVIPTRRQHLRDVLPGAALAGVLLEVVTLLFPVYIGVTHHANAAGQTAAVFFMLMFFMYLLGMITMVGATINAERAPQRRSVDDPVMRADPGDVLGGKLDLDGTESRGPTRAEDMPVEQRRRVAATGLGVLVAAAALAGLARERAGHRGALSRVAR